MCGHVGVVGQVNGNSEKAIRTMLILDSLRGEHSTGVAVVGRDNSEAKMAKQVGNPFELFGMKDYERAFVGMNRVVIGHNRYATQGAVNKRNAHPFDFDDLVGAHNGTLLNKYALPDAKDFDVDSENLFYSFQKIGVEETMKLVRGAWALVWWDKNNQEINFLRNGERTLYYTSTKDDSQVFWASEAWMLSVGLSKHGIAHQEILPFPEDMWLTMAVDKSGKLDKPYMIPLKGADPIVQNYYNGGASGRTFPNGGNNSGTKETTTGKTASQQVEEARKKGVTNSEKEVDNRSTLDNTFLKQEGELFEAVGIETDQYGAKYVIAFCAAKPFLQCRLYVNPKHSVDQHIGCEFLANVSGFSAVGSQDGAKVGYYRIDPWSVEIVLPPAKQEKNYPNHHGKYITEGAWRKDYSSCCYCTSPVDPEDVVNSVAFLTTAGEAICPDCATEPDCMQYVRIATL